MQEQARAEMGLGLFAQPFHPLGKPVRQCLKEDREAIILGDRLGYDEAFVGEHVSDLVENIPDALTFLASLAHSTSRIRLGSGTVNLPAHHPVTVATQVALLDNLCDGRFNFGVGTGGLLSDWEIFGNLDAETRLGRFAESLRHIFALWEGDGNYDLKGEHWTISTRNSTNTAGLGRIIKPLQQPHPPMFVSVASPSSASAVNAGKRGWSMMSGHFMPARTVRSHWRAYVEGAAQTGHMPDWRSWRVARSIYVAEDGAAARDYVYAAQSPYRHYYQDFRGKAAVRGVSHHFKDDPAMPDADLTDEYMLDTFVNCGNPDEVADQILGMRNAIGAFGTLLYVVVDWADPSLARRSMELMAHEVMPRVNARLADAAPVELAPGA